MSDPPPAKPKPGSLRDRIAAFENKGGGSAPAPAPAPVPRPKPGNVSWKPKPLSPPTSPGKTVDSSGANDARQLVGMSAADAKESIGMGGSLKERMAALQGRGGFGGASGGATSPPPRPSTEKPKWKPPPQVKPADEDGEEKKSGPEGGRSPSPPLRSPPLQSPPLRSPPLGALSQEEVKGDEEAKAEDESEPRGEVDEEEEERQRRAAIAARMARLGGARVGMGLPIFGKKPEINQKPERKSTSEVASPPPPPETEPKTGDAATNIPQPLPQEIKPDTGSESQDLPSQAQTQTMETIKPISEDTQESNITRTTETTTHETEDAQQEVSTSPHVQFEASSAVPEAQAPLSTKTPLDVTGSPETKETVRSPPSGSMPVPAIPKRAAPPRRRVAKPIAPSTGAVGAPPTEADVEEKLSEIAVKEDESLTSADDTSIQPEKKDEPQLTEVDARLEQPTDKHEGSEAPLPGLVEQAVVPQQPPTSAPEASEESGHVPEPSPHKAVEVGNALDDRLPTEEKAPSSSADRRSSLSTDSHIDKNVPTTAAFSDDKLAADSQSTDNDEVAGTGEYERVESDPRRSSDGPVEPVLEQQTKEVSKEIAPDDKEEEDEVAQRQRIAARLAKMGGINPLSPRPTPQASVVSPPPVDIERAASPPPSPPLDPVEPKEIEDVASVVPPKSSEVPVAALAHEASIAAKDDQDGAAISQEPDSADHEATEVDAGPSTEEPDEAQVTAPSPSSPSASSLAAPISDRFPTVPNASLNETGGVVSSASGNSTKGSERQMSFSTEATAINQPVAASASITTDVRSSAVPVKSHVIDEVLGQFRDEPEEVEEGWEEEAPELQVAPAGQSTLSEPESSEKLESVHDTPSNTEEDEECPPPLPTGRRPSVPSHSVVNAEEHEERPPPLPAGRRPSVPVHSVVGEEMMTPLASPRPSASTADTTAIHDSEIPPPVPSRKQSSIPALPEHTESEVTAQVSPLRPSSRPPVPLVVQNDEKQSNDVPPPLPAGRRVSATSASHRRTSSVEQPPTSTSPRNSLLKSPTVKHSVVPAPTNPEGTEGEILDEEEGDPIDPRFHSPNRISHPQIEASSVGAIHTEAASSPPAVEEAEEDEEQKRRRTIAERMARLGGMRMGFGGPPPPLNKRVHHEEDEVHAGVTSANPEEQTDETEEDEQARRERIRARLAQMGGVGMFGSPPPVPKSRPPALREEEQPNSASPPPPLPSNRPSQPEARRPSLPNSTIRAVDPEIKPESTKEEDSIPVDFEAEEPPPPVPPRTERRIPSSAPAHTERFNEPDLAPARQTSQMPPVPADNTIEEPEPVVEEVVPPPPPRPVRPPPSRAAPAAPPQSLPLSHTGDHTTVESEWELPDIPSGGLDIESNNNDLLASWSADSTQYPSSPSLTKRVEPSTSPLQSPPAIVASPNISQIQSQPQQHESQPRSSEELMAVWGRIGVQVIESATELAEKSKKTIVGDGSFAGFVDAVLRAVPNAQQPSKSAPGIPPTYGHIIYTQSGATVQRRITDIMPGDIIALYDAKLKGHKGLQTYHQHVGEQEPCVGVIQDFEPKKAKAKVLQASQSVAHQAVDNVSYRLEDLKSGTVKIFRVLEA